MERVTSYEDVKNEGEAEILKLFRRNLADDVLPQDNDRVLLKWLRGQNFHLKKTETLYREFIWCRKLHKLDEITKNWQIPEVVEKNGFFHPCGYAKDGTPVMYIAMGRGDYMGFIMSLDIIDIGKYCYYCLEKGLEICREQTKKLGKEFNECIFIIDMEDFTLNKFLCQTVIEVALDLFSMLQDQRPECWKKIFIVNAPAYFHTAFNVLKPILRSSFLRYVHVVSRDNTAGLLLKYIDAQSLPAFLGGKLLDSKDDPMCSEFLKFGGTIPERYFLRNQSPLLPSDNGVHSVWVYPKTCYNSSLVIREAGSNVQVEIRTERGSIYLAILYRKFGIDPENPDIPASNEWLNPRNEKCNVDIVSPSQHIQAHLSPLQSSVYAPWPGIYIFQFDNTGNWFTSRKIIYRFKVLPPSAT